jgi:hypothetical protein
LVVLRHLNKKILYYFKEALSDFKEALSAPPR